MSTVRVRFAPSPTGPLHMGGVRTALYNYLFAAKHKGTFILRIEDTDQTRFVPGAEAYIKESLKWCGIEPAEGEGYGGNYGPYTQSKRMDIYKPYAQQLVENGMAYYAFDTPEELDAVREQAKAAKIAAWQYNSITRNSMVNSLTLSADEVEKRIANNEPYVIRLKVPRNEEIRFHDEIRGWVVVNSNNIDDKVLFKSDGLPTYHLANVVDDHLMEISHVIRGEEWLPSAPLHVLLYKALGWEDSMPKFAHLPLILKPDGNGKLSKRDGDRLGFPVFPLEWNDPNSGEISSGYREKGYFSDAFINMLALLGWNPGDNREVMSRSELIEAFSLERVGKAGAKFDAEKTNWFNQQYLRQQSPEELAELFTPILKDAGLTPTTNLPAICALLSERAVFVKDMLEGAYFFKAPESYEDKTVSKKWKENSAQHLTDLKEAFNQLDTFTAAEIEASFKGYLEKNELGIGVVMPVLRVALTGLGSGPSLFQIIELLGKQEVVNRINTAIEKLA